MAAGFILFFFWLAIAAVYFGGTIPLVVADFGRDGELASE